MLNVSQIEPKFLDIATLPATAYQLVPHASRSDKYSHVPTIDVIDFCEKQLGLGLVQYRNASVRKPEKQGFQNHVMRFRSFDSKPNELGVHNEIVARNAHDGSKAWQLFAGKFRLVCSNGMTVMSEKHGSVSIGHRGADLFDRIKSAVLRLQEITTASDRLVQGWASKHLSYQEQWDFAEAALALRYPDPAKRIGEANLALMPRRPDDEAHDAWTIFNRVQENLTRGGQKARNQEGKLRTVRSIKSGDADLVFNGKLWALAEQAFT